MEDVEDEGEEEYNLFVTEDEICPICLSNIENPAFLSECFHGFCFSCILQWTEITPSCPLCKSEYPSIIYDVVSEDDFKQYDVRRKDDKSVVKDHITAATERRRSVYINGLIPTSEIRNQMRRSGKDHFEMYPALDNWIRRDILAILGPELCTDGIIANAVINIFNRFGIYDPKLVERVQKYLGKYTFQFVEEMRRFYETGCSIARYDENTMYS